MPDVGAGTSVPEKELTGTPGGLSTIARAALPLLPVVNRLPGARKAPISSYAGLAYRRGPVRVERAEVDAYAAVCGFPTKDTAPLPFPHMLAFSLHMAIMTDPAFPFPAVGTVHVENTITSHRPVAIGEELDLRVEASAPLPHAKGTALEFAATARIGDETVWESTSTYLRRGKPSDEGDAAPGLQLEVVPPGGTRWPLPSDLGRRYAAVSGDHNPIHLHPLTAKPLGFPRHIAHGMWSLARCVAALENRIGDAAQVDVAFKKPILLPSSVAFGSRPSGDVSVDGGGYEFSLTSPKDGSPHLVGRTTRL